MAKIRLFIGVALCVFLAGNSYASTEKEKKEALAYLSKFENEVSYQGGNWQKNPYAYTTELDLKVDGTTVDIAEVTYMIELGVDGNGQQRLYFKSFKTKSHQTEQASNAFARMSHFAVRKYEASCDTTKDNLKNSVVSVNGQNVKITTFCEPYEGGTLYSFTPTTKAGHDFVFNALTRGKNVLIGHWSDRGLVDISAIGFTKAWNSYGGNAL
ncbi:hypothetical protein [Vibrio owensii]|uniref:hypothetical protein n=1 Tax=Vibrio owensii TaxID=696485 RepID=UPI003CE4AB25